MTKFGMSYTGLLKKINEHFDPCNSSEKGLILISENEELSNLVKLTFSNHLSLYLKFLVYFSLSFVRYAVFGRDIQFYSIIRLPIESTEKVYINLKNGTLVFIYKDTVKKLYFKDVDFYEALYKLEFDDSILSVKKKGGALIVIFQKFKKREFIKPNQTIIELIKYLNSFHEEKEIANKDMSKFSVVYKIKQILSNQGLNEQQGILYINLVNTLLEKMDKNCFVLCHGDVWEPNIMKGPKDEIKLIDFDKSLFFLPCYDLVYYVCMTVYRVELNAILYRGQITQYQELVNLVDSKLFISNYMVVRDDVASCLIIILIIKSLEIDLFKNKVNMRTKMLREILNQHISGISK